MSQPEQPPVTISIVGTGTTSGGGVAPTPDGTIAKTPDHLPDLQVNVISPTIAVVVRFVRTYLTTFLGLITAAGFGAGHVFTATDLHGVIASSALVSFGAAGVDMIKNIITIFARLEGKYPIASASI